MLLALTTGVLQANALTRSLRAAVPASEAQEVKAQATAVKVFREREKPDGKYRNANIAFRRIEGNLEIFEDDDLASALEKASLKPELPESLRVMQSYARSIRAASKHQCQTVSAKLERAPEILPEEEATEWRGEELGGGNFEWTFPETADDEDNESDDDDEETVKRPKPFTIRYFQRDKRLRISGNDAVITVLRANAHTFRVYESGRLLTVQARSDEHPRAILLASGSDILIHGARTRLELQGCKRLFQSSCNLSVSF